MKRTIAFLLFQLYVYASYGQNPVLKTVPNHIDKDITLRYMDSLSKFNKVDTFITLLTNEGTSSRTYLLWVKKKTYYAIRISDVDVSDAHSLTLHLDTKNLGRLFVKEKENQLQLIPPIAHQDGCDFLFVTIKRKEYLVESGDCNNYVLDASLSSQRKELISMIKEALNSGKTEWSAVRIYNRGAD